MAIALHIKIKSVRFRKTMQQKWYLKSLTQQQKGGTNKNLTKAHVFNSAFGGVQIKICLSLTILKNGLRA